MEESLVVTATAPQGPQLARSTSEEKTQIASDGNQKSPNDSEYDSAGSYSEEEQKPRPSREHTESETDETVVLERESGDGQESAPARKVDDDEDKKNPQYIPKRGTFYEHDDRTIDDDDPAKAAELEKEKELKKKVWQDKKERWSHDRFNDSEQAPKSRAELVAIYGYDIRNEDGPPRARRRRRYGRGPNKYTRNWEDEDAYSKPPPARAKKPPKKPGRREDFPPLSQDRERQRNENERDDITTTTASVKDEPDERNEPPPIENNNVPTQEPPQPPIQDSQKTRVGSGRVVKPKREIKDSDYRGFTTKTRQVRNMKTDQKIVAKKKDDFIQTQNFTNKNNMQEVEKEMAKMSVQEGGHKGGGGGKHGGQRQGSVPPRLQSEQKGSKRYSSIRQRSLPESATPPFTQQHSNYYSNEFSQPNQVTQQNLIHQNAQIHPSSTSQVPQIAPPPLPPIPQVPVTATPILQAAPPQFAPPPFAQAPPPFLQPAPPPFLPQQPAQIINYVPSQPQFAQGGFQGYQQQFNPVTQPELYQPQQSGGITYYSTDQQVTQQRAAPLKRPKAAIPIVAPPPIDLKGKVVKEEDGSSYEGDVSGDSEQQTDSGASNVQESSAQQQLQQQQ